jgi:hypothetical protein
MGDSDSDIQQQTKQYLSEGSLLLSRVASFLPKLKQANETLLDTNSNAVIELEKRNDDSDSDNESTTVSDELDTDDKSRGQVIEMNIAMGDVSNNPVFQMLGGDTKDSDDSESEASEKETSATENAIQNLLNRKRTSASGGEEIMTPQKKSSTPLIKVIHESNKSA